VEFEDINSFSLLKSRKSILLMIYSNLNFDRNLEGVWECFSKALTKKFQSFFLFALN
jgi:hypothetical protein